MHCIFCDDLARAGELLLADEHAWVLLHPDWSPRGHVMIVARRHVENVSGLAQNEWLAFARTWQRVEQVLLELTGAERAMVLKLGIVTPHLHMHLYPARAGDTREEVFAAFDGRRSEPRDDAFVAELRRRLTLSAR